MATRIEPVIRSANRKNITFEAPTDYQEALLRRLGCATLTVADQARVPSMRCIKFVSRGDLGGQIAVPAEGCDAIVLPRYFAEPDSVAIDHLSFSLLLDVFWHQEIGHDAFVATFWGDDYVRGFRTDVITYRACRIVGVPDNPCVISRKDSNVQVAFNDDAEIMVISKHPDAGPLLFDGRPLAFWDDVFLKYFCEQVAETEAHVEHLRSDILVHVRDLAERLPRWPEIEAMQQG